MRWVGKHGAAVWHEGFVTLRVLITGATGFVGQAVCEQAVLHGFAVRVALRKPGELPGNVEPIIVGEINGATDWTNALRGVDVVIHLAARAHVMNDESADPLAEFCMVNVNGTESLARQAAHAGLKRLVYVSSIGVNGLSTKGNEAFSETDTPAPHNEYALSKWKAEQALQQIAGETGLEVVIVRPPLVYGPNAPGNFAELMRVLDKRIPLPLASVRNRRSLIYVQNLVDTLLVCATHPVAAGQTWLVSDGEDISTPDLLRRLGSAMGRPARLFSCPPALLKMAGRLIGKSNQVERLLDSLQIDGGNIRRELNWTPPYTLQQGLQATAEWYRNTRL